MFTFDKRIIKLPIAERSITVYDINKGDPPTFIIEGKTSMVGFRLSGIVQYNLRTVIDDGAKIAELSEFHENLRQELIGDHIMEDGDELGTVHRHNYFFTKIDERSAMFTDDNDAVTFDDLKDRRVYKCRLTAIIPYVTLFEGKYRPKVILKRAEFLEHPRQHTIVPARPDQRRGPAEIAAMQRQRNRQNQRRRPPTEPKKIPPHFQAMFNKLPEEEKNCPICLEQMTEDLALTPCFHFFHGKCLTESRKRKNECPSCRHNL
jgi:hypothetical protein